MQSISVFLDITKFTYFLLKNAEVSRTQGACHVIHIFFGSSLGKVKLSQASSLQDMCDRSYGGGGGVFLHDCRYQSSHQNYKTKS